MDARTKAKLIRQAVKQAGYDYTLSFNDKSKSGVRRLKCMRNGYNYGETKYAEWLKQINQQLKDAGVTVISSEFELLERPFYGTYYAYVARFTDDE